MPHISHKRMKPEVASALSESFLDVLSHPRSKAEARAVSEELFTKTERLMLGKRIAIVSMLSDGYSQAEVCRAIGVTPQTVSRVYKDVASGNCKKLAKAARDIAGSGGFAEDIGLSS